MLQYYCIAEFFLKISVFKKEWDRKSTERRIKNVHFSMFLSMSMGTGSSRTAFIVAIAVLACLLGAEIAGICVLISKIVRARRARQSYERRLEEEDQDSSYLRGIGAAAILTAIPQSLQLTFLVLLGLTALLAILFVVLLLIFRACGYDYRAPGRHSVADKIPEEPAEEETLPTEETAEEEAFSALWQETDEEQSQEAYVEIPEEGAAEDAFDVFAEEPEAELLQVEDETVETVYEEAVVETLPVTELGGSAEQAGAQQPYKVVERIVTETVKEIYKEVPAETAPSNNDAVLEKLVDLLDYEIRSRRETEESTNAVANESVPTFATSIDNDEEDEDDDLTEGDEEQGDEGDEGESDDRFTGNEKIIGFNEETGCYIVAHYRKSFEAKLIQSQPRIKQYYSALKNALLSYKGTKNRISWTADSFHNGRHPLAKINVKTRILEIYLALDPASLEGTVYRGRDVSDKKKYADTPFQYKVRTPRKFKWAMELVQRVCEEHGLSPIDIEPVDYEAMYPFEETDALVARKLIKEYIREEKPATSFELAPDHTPDVPDEDESVIPANANFSWEFDNERMAAAEEETEQTLPEEEVETVEPAEEAVEEETVESVATDREGTVVRETVRVTEMRYTERYYPDGETAYEESVKTSEPIAEIEAPEATEEETEAWEEAASSEEVEAPEDVETFETLDEAEDEALVFSDEEIFAQEPEETVEETVEEVPAYEAPTEPSPNINTAVAKVDLCAIEAHYRNGETVNLQTLKERQLVIDSAEILKVRASGAMTKALNVEAHQFTFDALIAIEGAGGSAAMIR